VDRAAESEFSEFMHSRWLQLLRLGFVLTGDTGLAEDLAQTALARAYASWPRIRRAWDPDAYVRRVMVLRFWLDMTEAQVAETLGCSVGNVKSQAARALARLRAGTDLGEEVSREQL